MSWSPRTVADIVAAALGVRIIARIQASLSRVAAAASRREVDTAALWPCAPLATTVVTPLTAIGLRAGAAAGRMGGIDAVAATIRARPTFFADRRIGQRLEWNWRCWRSVAGRLRRAPGGR